MLQELQDDQTAFGISPSFTSNAHSEIAEEYFDTFRLMTQVMKTHGLRAIRSKAMVQHFFSVSYEWEPEEIMEANLCVILARK